MYFLSLEDEMKKLRFYKQGNSIEERYKIRKHNIEILLGELDKKLKKADDRINRESHEMFKHNILHFMHDNL